MTEWIAAKDRLPTQQDADCYGNVWCSVNGRVFQRQWDNWLRHVPEWWRFWWMPTGIVKPKPPDGSPTDTPVGGESPWNGQQGDGW